MSSRKVLRSQENDATLPTLGYAGPTAKLKAAPTTTTISSPNNGGPPTAPRSAFMCFTDCKKLEIMKANGIVEESDELLKLVASEWRSLSTNDRAYWDEVARNDKVRFVREKAAYKGPWSVPKRRAKKHPLAPKRPMSAFLMFSQKRRSQVKLDNPDMSNTDVSRLLGEMWRNASAKERAPYVEKEQGQRAVYKEQIKKFREDQAKLDAASRTSHKTVQKQMAEYPPPLTATAARPTYETLSSSLPSAFETAVRIGTVEDAANAADKAGGQRVMFRHSFGAPSSSFRSSHLFDTHRSAPPSHHGAPPSHHIAPPSHHSTAPSHHSAPEYYNYPPPDHRATAYPPPVHRPLPPLRFEDDDDLMYNSGHGFFSDGLNFNFYSGSNGYP
ncbi:Nuclear autoantigen Sp-100 (Fragment) [Seminavis robusta]|uniref:Nuclear autoantigen Sp-100 n=1 Tax=Seminavis robusta TaxID=568900 RepID=A0A9N8E804_9STRA